MPDQTFTCRDCGNPFVFTDEERQAFASKGFTHPPSRCVSCRETRAATRAQDPRSNFANNNQRREDPGMHPAVCASCGKATEVPFLPRGDRPVYCRDCYSSRARSTSGSGGRSY